MKRVGSRSELFLLAIIVLVAIFLRTFRLSDLPRGMTGDEAVRGLEASLVARGERYPVFFEENFGEEPLHAYLVAILFRLLGPSVLAIRAASALVGILTVPLFYLLVKELFPGKAGSWSIVRILATAWLATSYWHVVYSRYGLEPILVPFFAVLIIYCLWRGLNSGLRFFFLSTGFFLGLSLYTYQAARFLPILVSVVLAYYAWSNRRFLHERWVDVLVMLVAFMIAVAPLAVYALNHPDVFFGRAVGVSIFNPELNQGSPIRALGVALVKSAAMYGFQADLNPEHNPARRPILDSMTTAFLVLGLIIAVRRCREVRYLFLVMWLVIMSLPAAVTAESLPHFSRAIGALPAVCIFPAIAVVAASEWLETKLGSGRLTIAANSLLISIPLVFTGATTYWDYFVVWDTREDLRQGYDGAYTVAAAVMNQTQVPDSIWILPITPIVPSGYGGDHFDFLYHGSAPYHSVRVDEATAPSEMSTLCRGRLKALVVDWKGYVLEEAYDAMAADPKGLIPFLFHKYGRELDRRSYEAFDVVTYKVPGSAAFSIAENFEPLTVNFGDELMLTGMAFGGSSVQDTSTPQDVERRELPSGKSGWVVLRWRALTVPSGNYKVAVYLQDKGDHRAGQVDKLLLSNYLHPTRDWQAGQEEIDYYTLPSWGGTAPGRYKVGVTVYDAESLEVVRTAGGRQTRELGMMEIVRPLVAAGVDPEVGIEKDRGEVAPGIRLLGYDLPRREANPGDELSVALYWQALEDVDRDYLLAVQLTDDKGEVRTERFDSPVYGTYPTTEWVEGEVLKDWHDVALPADIPQGSYQVSLAISENDRLLYRVSLETIVMRGRARQFVVPEIQHPVEAKLGQGVQFLGYDLSSDEVAAGGAFQLTLYWQALQEIPISYTVFTHLLDNEERIWGQKDAVPGDGAPATTSWVEGEIITDEYEIVVDPEAPDGEYAVEIGMYDSSTAQRLPIYSDGQRLEGDRLVLGVVQVIP